MPALLGEHQRMTPIAAQLRPQAAHVTAGPPWGAKDAFAGAVGEQPD
jgi:hypothetical protein